MKAKSAMSGKTLILAHRKELVEQAARHCTLTYPTKSIEIEMGNLHASGNADITVASIASITSKDRLTKFDPISFKLVLVDEAHHIVARSYLKTLEHFNLHQRNHASPVLVGVSATLTRADGLGLSKALDHIVFHRDFTEMIRDKRLCDLVFTTVQSPADISEVKVQGRFADFITAELSRAVNTPEVNAITVATWQVKAQRKRHSTLIFCVDVAHVLGIVNSFRARGIDARYVTGTTKQTDRFEILEAFKNQEFPVLVNCGVFTEGTDIPNIDCIILARPTRSRNLLIQMIGRGMRLHPDKKDCHVIDMVSNLETGIVTTPTLFGLDPDIILNETGIQEIENHDAEEWKERFSELQRKKGRFSGVSGLEMTDYDSVFDLLKDPVGERPIRALSQLAWVSVGDDRYILGGPDGTYVRLEKSTSHINILISKFNSKKSTIWQNGESSAIDSSFFQHIKKEIFPLANSQNGPTSDGYYTLWIIRSLSSFGGRGFAKPRLVLLHEHFDAAVRAADLYAGTIFPRSFVSLWAKWRNAKPTPGQLGMLKKTKSDSSHLESSSITKGAAADMITKLMHGGRRRYVEHKKARWRTEKMREKLRAHYEEQNRISEVKVGPLGA